MISTNANLERSVFFSFWKQPKLSRLGSNLLWGLIKQLKIALKSHQTLIDYTLRNRFLHILILDTQKYKKTKKQNKTKHVLFCFQTINKRVLSNIDKTLDHLNWAISNDNRKHIICSNYMIKLPYYKAFVNLIFLFMVWNILKKTYYWLKTKLWSIELINQQLIQNTWKLTTYPKKLLLKNNYKQVDLWTSSFYLNVALNILYYLRQKNWKLLWSYKINKYQHFDKCLIITSLFTQTRTNLRWDKYSCSHALCYILKLRKVLLSLMMTLYFSKQLQKATILLNHITDRLLNDRILFKKKVSLSVLKKWEKHLRFLRLCNLVFIKGMRLHITGKIKKSMRKHKYCFKRGNTSVASVTTLINHENTYLKSRVGIISINLWLFF